MKAADKMDGDAPDVRQVLGDEYEMHLMGALSLRFVYEDAVRPFKGVSPRPLLQPNGAIAQYLVEGLPGVGPETARRLMSHFGTARGVFGATLLQLRECQGIGPKTAEAIAGALDLCPTAFRQTKTPPNRQTKSERRRELGCTRPHRPACFDGFSR